jgi:hypothetical protein
MIFNEQETFDQMAGNYSIMKQAVRDLMTAEGAPGATSTDALEVVNWFQVMSARAKILAVASTDYAAAVDTWMQSLKKPEWPDTIN